MVLCHASTITFEKALKATVHGAAFDSVAKNSWVILAVEDVDDEVF